MRWEEAEARRLAEVNHQPEPQIPAQSLRIYADVEPVFLGAIGDNDKYLRRSAAFALGCLESKSDAARQALDKALTDPEAMVRQNAAYALGQFAEDALPSIKRALRDSDSKVKRDAATVLLQKMSDAGKVHDLLPDLLPMCSDKDSEAQRAALAVLVRIVEPKDKDAIPALRSVLTVQDIENRRNAALAMSNIGGPDTVDALPVLLEAARNGDPELRRQAVLAVRNVGKEAAPAVNELIRYLKEDRDPETRKNAAMALGGIGSASAPAIPVLVSKIQDGRENREVRFECAMSMQRIGAVPAAKEVIPTLLAFLKDTRQDTKVRERVVWALRPHAGNLRKVDGMKETFERIMKEPRTDGPDGNKMMRFDCAYMLGMIWQSEAPDNALNVLLEFLRDKEIKIYVGTGSTVDITGQERKGGSAKVNEKGEGDGRVMAANALSAIGAGRYAGRADIMAQLRAILNEPNVDPALRKRVTELIQAAQ
jgi:HEAT repeat protein